MWKQWRERPLTSGSLFRLALSCRSFQVLALTTTSVCHNLEIHLRRDKLPGSTHTHREIEKSNFWLSLLISKHFLPIGCITQPVGVSWRFLPANQEFNSTLPIFLMGPCQGRAGLGTASTARSVWRHRIGPMLLTRYDLWLEFRTRAAVLKECCFSSRHWRKHFGRSH